MLLEKSTSRMHKALHFVDVELVKLLLIEFDVTLDKANALHYTAAYCDTKVVYQVFSPDVVDFNLRNAWCYTVLHVAALRKEPSIIVPILSRGACAIETTLSVVSICKRYIDILCINVLEQEVHKNGMDGNSSRSTSAITDDLPMKLLCREMSYRCLLHILDFYKVA